MYLVMNSFFSELPGCPDRLVHILWLVLLVEIQEAWKEAGYAQPFAD
jgi:hypothetical protein